MAAAETGLLYQRRWLADGKAGHLCRLVGVLAEKSPGAYQCCRVCAEKVGRVYRSEELARKVAVRQLVFLGAERLCLVQRPHFIGVGSAALVHRGLFFGVSLAAPVHRPRFLGATSAEAVHHPQFRGAPRFARHPATRWIAPAARVKDTSYHNSVALYKTRYNDSSASKNRKSLQNHNNRTYSYIDIDNASWVSFQQGT